ncbi:hypothetical protein BaRGS_00000877 [Batillaria attramentaria]|uniref:Pheromone biosynthesis activating neuropeptide n=1 Tax=Batillaria attramentaria TaxID=370345 RepID=A0ABD0M972_9CAEN
MFAFLFFCKPEISASQTADSSRNIASTYPDSAGSADEQESLQVVPTCVLFRTPETRRRSEVFYTPEIHRTPSVRRTPYVKYGQRVLGQLQLPLSLQNVSPDGTVEEDDIHYVVYRADTAHRHHGNSFQSFKPSGEYEERMDLFS